MKNYFKPKKFEFYRGKTIYECVGIRLYKKYLPTTGDIARRQKNIVQINLGKGKRIKELYKYEKQTRNYELRHIIGFVGFIILIFVIDKKLNLFDFMFLTILNLYINVYPIFLQRYNRIRIIRVLLNNGKMSPYAQ